MTDQIPAVAFYGTTVARHNGYCLRRDERPDGTVNWLTAPPPDGHRIDHKPGTADMFSVDPEPRDIYGNTGSTNYARSLLAAVEAANVFAGIVNAAADRWKETND